MFRYPGDDHDFISVFTGDRKFGRPEEIKSYFGKSSTHEDTEKESLKKYRTQTSSCSSGTCGG